MHTPRRKMNMMFVLVAAAGCLLSAKSALAQSPTGWYPTARRFDVDSMVKLGPVYIPAASPNHRDEPNVWLLEIGGQRSFWSMYAPKILSNYSQARFELEYATGQEDKPPFLSIRRNGARKEFQVSDFKEKELQSLAKSWPGAVEQFRAGELNMEVLGAWIYKCTKGMSADHQGVQPQKLEIADLTQEESGIGVLGGKPNEYVLYRTRESIAADPKYPTKALQDAAWDEQQSVLDELAVRAVKFHGLFRARKAPIDRKFDGKTLYELLAAGSSQDQPIVCLYWGSPNPTARERWGPFKPSHPSGSKAFADYVEQQVLTCLGVDKLLAKEISHSGADVVTVASAPRNTVAASGTGTTQPCNDKGVAPNEKR